MVVGVEGYYLGPGGGGNEAESSIDMRGRMVGRLAIVEPERRGHWPGLIMGM